MKHTGLAAGIVMVGLSLAACGGSDDKPASESSAGYCKELKSAQTTIGAPASNVSIKDSLKTFHSLAASAPDKVSAQWKVLDGAFVELEAAFKKAKVDFTDSAAAQKALTSGKIPLDVIQKLTSADVTKARTAIEEHAKTACKVDISGS